MVYCKDCGHESHCGVSLERDEPWPTSGRSRQELPQRLLEICKNCRCELCVGD